MGSDAPVIYEILSTKHGDAKIGVATLNAPRSLNALTIPMVDSLYEQLKKWQHDASIVCVFLQGAGDRAFCAGGDVVQIVTAGSQQEPSAETFFEKEYRLDYLIHLYKKPLICWGQGIVMGGGVGLMAGASVRVVTETSRLAMPEISIGLFPDVGASYFLSRMPAQVGLYLGLTASHINAADALFLGLADRFIKSEHKQRVLEALRSADWSNTSSMSAADSQAYNLKLINPIMRDMALVSRPGLPVSPVRTHLDFIREICDGDTCVEIVNQILHANTDDPWIQKGVSALRQGCPTTAHIVYEQLKRAKYLSLKDIFRMDLVIASHCVRGQDFQEGVRALLIDKDNEPEWQYQSVTHVPKRHVDQYFMPLWEDHPLDGYLD